MAWPSNMDDVICNGFSREVLPYLVQAIDNKRVKWIEQGASCYEALGTGQFDYLGFRYEMAEYSEVVVSIKKLGASPEGYCPDEEPERYNEAVRKMADETMTFMELKQAKEKGEQTVNGRAWGTW